MEYSISAILKMQIYIYEYEHDDHATEQEKKKNLNLIHCLLKALYGWVPINIISKMEIVIML